ncbi:GIY-YIG nuclease family protein, partial [Thermophilibacter provencensis]
KNGYLSTVCCDIAYVFNLDSYLNEATVKEILPALYSGDTFSGYDRVHLPYAKLDRIFRREIMPSYYDALESVTGVYCLTDTRTGKLYIGSATGEGGVAARWGNYLDSKHGGNKKLRELYDREGEEYFRENFEFTLLEYFGMSYDPQKVLEREQWWKDCLDTRAHGYNDN